MKGEPLELVAPHGAESRKRGAGTAGNHYKVGQAGWGAAPWTVLIPTRDGMARTTHWDVAGGPYQTAPREGWPTFLARTFGEGRYWVQSGGASPVRVRFRVTARMVDAAERNGNPAPAPAQNGGELAAVLESVRSLSEEVRDLRRTRTTNPGPAPVDLEALVERVAERVREDLPEEEDGLSPRDLLTAFMQWRQMEARTEVRQPNPAPAPAPAPPVPAPPAPAADAWSQVLREIQSLGLAPEVVSEQVAQLRAAMGAS